MLATKYDRACKVQFRSVDRIESRNVRDVPRCVCCAVEFWTTIHAVPRPQIRVAYLQPIEPASRILMGADLRIELMATRAQRDSVFQFVASRIELTWHEMVSVDFSRTAHRTIPAPIIPHRIAP